MPLLLAILLVPLLLLFLFFEVASTGLERLGFSPAVGAGALLLMVLGSFVNIPLSRTRMVEVEESRFFGLVRQRRLQAQGVGLNVGGGLIPLGIALYLFATQVPVSVLALPLLLMTGVAYGTSRVVAGRGIALSVFVPPLFAALFAVLAVPEDPAPVAFTAGVFGVILGADVLRLRQAARETSGVLSIGGAGVFDAVFLVGIAAALLAGF